jgi:hypothetical protein
MSAQKSLDWREGARDREAKVGKNNWRKSPEFYKIIALFVC